MASKKVSKKFAKREFETIGLALIIYCLFALFVPLLLDELFSLYDVGKFGPLEISVLIKILVILIGTILPFIIIDLAGKKKKREIVRVKIPFSEILVESLLFFTICSAAIFITTSVTTYFGLPGEVVSSIGMPLTSDKLDDLGYVLMFVLIAPILEEYAYRKILLRSLSKYGKYFALVATSIVYGLAHVSLKEMIPAFVMSYELGKIYLRYKSVKPCMAIHVIFNFFLYFLFVIPEKASIYLSILLTLIYLIVLLLIILRKFVRIVVRKSKSSNLVLKMFLKTLPVSVSLALFIIHSLLMMLLSI